MAIKTDPLYQWIEETNAAPADQGTTFGFPDWMGGADRSPARPIYPDRTYDRNEHVPDWSNTQDVAEAYNWGGGQDMYAAMASGEATMAANAEKKRKEEAIAELYRNQATSGNSGSGYNLQSVIDQINESFYRQQQGLDAAKGAGASGIQNAYNQFSSNIGRNYADYSGAAQQSQAAMAQRVAQQIAEQQARQTALQQSAQSMGQNIGALTQQQAGNLASLQSSAGFQQDLSQRMAQIVADNQRSMENTGELVRQGASGNLETNYQALLGALQSGREQNIMSAQQTAASSAGSPAKERTSKDVYDDLNYASKIEKLVYGDKSANPFSGVSKDKLFEIWYNATGSDDPKQQALADELAQYLPED